VRTEAPTMPGDTPLRPRPPVTDEIGKDVGGSVEATPSPPVPRVTAGRKKGRWGCRSLWPAEKQGDGLLVWAPPLWQWRRSGEEAVEEDGGGGGGRGPRGGGGARPAGG
jgi:hypothetical protein